MVNTNEIIIMVIAFGALLALARRLTRDPKILLLLSLSAVPALFLAVEGATQFLTVDETYMILELEDTRVFNYRQWNMGGYRTSILVTGTLTNLLDDVVLSDTRTDVDLHALAKTIHWLVGFGVLVLIYLTIRRGFIPPEQEKMFFVGFFNVSLLLPTNILALKIINYDLLSMMLGVLCVSLTLLALKQRRLLPAFLAVVAGTLASQEKIIASPMLALAMFSGTFIAATYSGGILPQIGKRTKKSELEASPEVLDRLAWLRAVGVWLGLVLTSMIVVSLTWGIVNALHKGLRLNLKAALDPLVGFLAPLLDRIPAGMQLAVRGSSNSIAEAMLVFALVGFLALLWSMLYHRIRRFAFVSRMSAVAFGAAVLGSIITLGFLVYAAKYITVYVMPTIPVGPDIYLPKLFNNQAYHFMVRTFWEYTVNQIMSSYGQMGAPIVVAFWIAFFASAAVLVIRRRVASVCGYWTAAQCLALLFPFLYAITQTPASSRYQNLFIFLLCLAGLMLVLRAAAMLAPRVRITAFAILLAASVAELSMYRPVIASFRPFWAVPDSTYGQVSQRGILKLGWNGWGEEVFLAAARIDKEYRKPGERLRIFTSYPGRWLHNDSLISYYGPNERLRAVGSSDYYIVSRAHYETGYPFPYGIKPLFTVEYNKQVVVWVYRGDQLTNRIIAMVPESQGGFIAEIPEYTALANDPANLQRSRLVLYENGRRLGPAHAPFDSIRKVGRGHYNHWQDVLFFSATDNSDARTNGRVYSFEFEPVK